MIPLDPAALVALSLHASFDGGRVTLAQVVGQLPDPQELPAGAWVSLDGGSAPPRGLWQRLRGAAPAEIELALRCTALFARGYVRVCAANGVAYAQVPEHP